MKRILTTAVLVVSVSIGGLVAEAPLTADAAVCHTTACVKAAAHAVTVEQVYGPLYGKYKAMYPTALNWNNNGCSFPAFMYDIRGLGTVISHYGAEFQKSCDRHDFGYRNHALSGAARATVDQRLRDNMYHQCDVNHTDFLPPWVACRAAAKLIFEVVDQFGGSFW
jgi:Prokaryotic phospholipase A2